MKGLLLCVLAILISPLPALALFAEVTFRPSDGEPVPDGYRIEWGARSGSHPNVAPIVRIEPADDGLVRGYADVGSLDSGRLTYFVLHAYIAYPDGEMRSEKSTEFLYGKRQPGTPGSLTVHRLLDELPPE